MSDLTAKFGTLEDLITANETAANTDRDLTNTKLQSVIDELALMQASEVSFRASLLAAIGALDPCACSGTPTLIVPPVGTTPIPVNEELCKRIQAFLHTMTEIFTVLDAASAFTIGLNFSLIVNSFNQVVASIESGSDLPVISYPEAVSLVGKMINYVALNILRGATLTGSFSSIVLDLRDALISSTSGSAAQVSYGTLVNASSLDSDIKDVINGAAYGALFSYYFDPDTSPNLSGYDGTVCGVIDCFELTSSASSVTCGGGVNAILWSSPFDQQFSDGAGCTSTDPVWTDTNLVGYTITVDANVRLFTGSGGFIDLVPATPVTVPTGTGKAAMILQSGSAPFHAELCPPVV